MGVASSGNASNLTLSTSTVGENIILQGSTTDSVRGVYIDNTKIIGQQESAITTVSGTADATYSANEVTLINAQTTAINAILTALRNHGLIDT